MQNYYKRNITGISSVEFFWGLGLPVIVESTFLSLFVKNLGGSGFLIGLIPAVLISGTTFFPFLSGYFTSHMKSKKKAVILLHVITSIPVLILGLSLLLNLADNLKLAVFFCCYALISISIGMTQPVWQNYLVRLFQVEQNLKAHSIMYIVQYFTRIITGFIITLIVKNFKYSNISSSLIFIITGIILGLSSFLFLITVEMSQDAANEKRPKNIIKFTKDSLKKIFANKNFMKYLINDIELYIITTFTSFYAVYAADFCGIKSSTAAGMFSVFQYAGSITMLIFLGSLNIFKIKTKLLISKLFTVSGILLIIFSTSAESFLVTSFLIGSARGIRFLIYATAVKILSGEKDSTNYFSYAPMILLPVSLSIPVLSGILIDFDPLKGAASYKLLFFMMIGIVTAAFYALMKTDFSKKIPAAPQITAAGFENIKS